MPSAIVIACPFVFSVIDGHMRAWNLAIPGPFIRIGKRRRLCETHHMLLQRLAICVLDDAQTHLSTLAPDRADDGRPVIVIGAMPTLFVGPTPRRVRRITMFSAFFPPRSETSRQFQLWHLATASRTGGAVHCRASVGADDAPYHKPSPARGINSPWVHPCTRRARVESLALDAGVCSQTASRYTPYTPFDTAGSDTASHDYAEFVQRRGPVSHWPHSPDTASRVDENASATRSHRVRRHISQELESPCQQEYCPAEQLSIRLQLV